MATEVITPPKEESTKAVIKFGTDGWRGIIADDFTFASPACRRSTPVIAPICTVGPVSPIEMPSSRSGSSRCVA